ncbi:MAG: segregation and condensation protein segregation and condensation protein [Candidatus Parcubacteria bacterium]|jgi:segregation and condensation protein A
MSDTPQKEGEFKVKTAAFEGPLDLLLNLIEKRKLFINDISLSQVAEDYIQHVNSLPTYNMSDRTQFIVIASTLLLIKAKSLLPTISLTDDEQGSIDDLEQRLRELELMRRLGGIIKDNYGTRIIFPRGEIKQTIQVFAPSQDTSVANLTEAIHRVLFSLPKKIEPPKVTVKKAISLEEMIGNLTDRIQRAVRISFKEFSQAHKAERVHVIVSFLAMLELVKQGVINVHQENNFDEIQMESHDIGIPRY